MTDHKNKRNPVHVKNSNIKFKNKHTKNKLAKKVKQIHKNKESFTTTNLLNSDITKVINIKNESKHKVTGQVQNRKGKQFSNQKQKQEKPDKENKISNQTKNKINTKKSAEKTKFKIQQAQKLNERTKKLSSILEKQLKQKKNKNLDSSQKSNNDSQVPVNNLDIKHLKKLLANKQKEQKKEVKAEPQSLRQRMMTKLKASRFRYLNETLYNNESSKSKKYFKSDPDAFKAYHEGYKHQVEQWPLNPLNVIISSIKKMPRTHIIADFGCGEAKLATAVPQKVHSFDFVSLNENVTVCDVAHTPLLTSGVHVVVFCLSLMGTNLRDYIIEANRVLKKDGILKIAEVESRFEEVEDFIKAVTSYGFKSIWKDLSHNLFYFLDFKKEKDIGSNRNKLPEIILKPCLYKKR